MTRATALAAVAVAAVAGCSNLLGFSAPREAIDAPAGGDAPVDAGPGTLHVITGGTAGSNAGVITSDPPGITCPGTCDAAFAAGTAVTLSATPSGSAGVDFTGFHGGGCSGSAVTCQLTVAGDATIYARYFDEHHFNIIFASSTLQAPGSFDSVDHADELCNQLGSAAGVPGPFVAWLSTNSQRALDRLDAQEPAGAPVGVWARVDGQVVFGQQPTLLSGAIAFPPRLDEFGSDVGDTALALTGTTGSGSSASGCSEYASTSDPALVLGGEPAGGTDRWSSLEGLSCAAPVHIYCLGMQTNEPLGGSAALGPTIVFVSSGTMTGSGGVAGGDALCGSDAAAAGFTGRVNSALITPGGGMTVADRFLHLNFGGAAQRPDGVALAPAMSELLAGSAFAAVPNVTAAGAFVDEDVWVGAGDFASFEGDCNGWTSANASDLGVTRPAATTRGAAVAQQATCDQQKHVLCVSYFPLTE